MKLGIVGGMGAGKSTVVTLITEQIPCQVIGADEIGHRILLQGEKAYQPVIDAFGIGILDETQTIVRKELGKIVFSSKENLQRLNAITHPIIFEETKRMIEVYEREKVPCIIIDAALLVEIGLVQLTDYVIGVDAKDSVRLERVMKRDGFGEEEARTRINKQKKWEELEEIIDYTINNDGDYEATKKQVEVLINTLKQLEK